MDKSNNNEIKEKENTLCINGVCQIAGSDFNKIEKTNTSNMLNLEIKEED